LIEDANWKPMERPDPPIHTAFQGVSQIAFFVDNIEEVIKKVEARQLRVAWKLITVAELRMKEFFVRDNEGNIVQFIERF
jgi:methylmalonyl-CoA/ethylmalonyl-CoA epimerase